MPIIFTTGNIFNSECEVLVNTVNCVGVMGAGLAKQFKEKYDDEIMLDYKEACRRGTLKPGTIQFIRLYGPGPYGIINFATKDHWRNPSQLSWIESGLQSLRKFIQVRQITSIACPRFGCGLGGLDWNQVKPLIEKYLGDLNCNVKVY